jgi:hypothetical protein
LLTRQIAHQLQTVTSSIGTGYRRPMERKPIPGYSIANPMPHLRRPVPDDFWQQYVEQGWETIREEYGTHTRVIRRWIEEVGRERLTAARAEYLRRKREQEAPIRARSRRIRELAKRYHEW